MFVYPDKKCLYCIRFRLPVKNPFNTGANSMRVMLAVCAVFIVGFAPIARTEPVRNGNELALVWSTNNVAG